MDPLGVVCRTPLCAFLVAWCVRSEFTSRGSEFARWARKPYYITGILGFVLHHILFIDICIIVYYIILFLTRIVNIKASYYSLIYNHVLWRTAGYPKKPSYFLLNAQYGIPSEVFHTDSSQPLHHVVFNSAYRARIIVKGRRRGRKKPYFIETTTKRYFSKIWSENPGRGIFGPHAAYSAINRHLKRTSGHAPKRGRKQRARH